MNQSEKIIVRSLAFLMATLISAAVFGLFSSWAWMQLDPAQQETIAAINAPWIAAHEDRSFVMRAHAHDIGNGAPRNGAVAKVANTP